MPIPAPGFVRSLLARIVRKRPGPGVGLTSVDDARRLADAERALGETPDGCAWLDERTASDLDLGLVFESIDRTASPTGAQALWRWLVAPAQRLDVVAARERRLAELADPAHRARLQAELAAVGRVDAGHLPRLLWEPTVHAPAARFVALAGALVATAVLAVLWPPLVLALIALLAVNVMVDDWMKLGLAQHARALEALGEVLRTSSRLVQRGLLPAAIATRLADDLEQLAPLRRRIGVLAVQDPFGAVDFFRAGLLIGQITLARCLGLIARERARLRRVVLGLGELDALVSVAAVRAERADARLPALAEHATVIEARELVHPAIAGAIGNDLVLDRSSLLVTGSNMSGKSTFLRALAINAILAQSIHTTFGRWRAPLVRVYSAMRIADDVAAGVSTYAAEVAAMGALVAQRSEPGAAPALFVIDEPFTGTNPALRVPIVVSVLDYLAARDFVVVATHDLDVAAQVAPAFARGYFCELGESGDQFDYRLRTGVAPSSNALALLERAGYPAEVVREARRRSSSLRR